MQRSILHRARLIQADHHGWIQLGFKTVKVVKTRDVLLEVGGVRSTVLYLPYRILLWFIIQPLLPCFGPWFVPTWQYAIISLTVTLSFWCGLISFAWGITSYILRTASEVNQLVIMLVLKRTFVWTWPGRFVALCSLGHISAIAPLSFLTPTNDPQFSALPCPVP